MLMLSIRRIFRDKGRFACLLIVFTLATALWGLSLSLSNASALNEKAVEDSVQTIAIRQDVKENAVFADGSSYPALKEFDETAIDEAIKASGVVLSKNRGVAFSGYSEGVTPLTSGAFDPEKYDSSKDGPWNTAAFTVKCLSIETTDIPLSYTFVDDTFEPAYGTHYFVTVQVEKVHALSPYYAVPGTIEIQGHYMDEKGQIPFQEGKSYFVFGQYWQEPLQLKRIERTAEGKKVIYEQPDNAMGHLFLKLNGYHPPEEIALLEDGTRHVTIYQVEGYPIVSIPDDAYIEKAMRFIRQNCGMLTVFGVERLEHIALFAMGEAYLSKGRVFTGAESAQGVNVCLVDEVFAAENNLAVGQTIPLEIFENYFYYDIEYGATEATNFHMVDFFPEHEPIMQSQFTIIGMYKAPLWQSGMYCFSPNTLIVPKNSLRGESLFDLPAIQSLTIQNGGRQAFAYALSEKGIDEELYAVFDGGYDDIKDSLASMHEDTRLLLYVCAVLFAVTMAVALMMTAVRMEREADILRRLGTGRWEVFRYAMGCLIPVLLAAAVLANAIVYCASTPILTWVGWLYAFEQQLFSNMNGTVHVTQAENVGITAACAVIAGFGMACVMAAIAAGLIATKKNLITRRWHSK